MTGPAQTPVLFVKAGDTNIWFSPECVKALADASLDPDDFGTYAHVNAKIMMAKARVEAAAEAQRLGLRDADKIRPSARDRALANSTAGHMIHNSVAQRTRRNECTNAIDGYHHDNAPTTPMENGAQPRGGQTVARGSVNRTWSDDEKLALADRRPPSTAPFPAPPAPATGRVDNRPLEPGRDAGPPPGSGYGYSERDRHADERRRIDDLARNNAARQRSYEAPAGNGATGSGSSAPPAPVASATSPTLPANGALANGGGGANPTAADCIESFKKLAEKQMKDACADATVRNGALEHDPARAAERARLEKERDAAQDAMDDIDRRLSAAGSGPFSARTYLALSEQRATQQARHATALRGLRDLDNAACLRAQGERLRGTTLGGGTADPVRTDGRFPEIPNDRA